MNRFMTNNCVCTFCNHCHLGAPTREWSMHSYARSVLDNWLTFFIGKRGFVRYRGLEMAQSCRMLTNIAQCVIQQ
eukprot:COSAG02_NODE_19118_length_899_cov_1.115000_1_plen_75_part_00